MKRLDALPSASRSSQVETGLVTEISAVPAYNPSSMKISKARAT